MQNAWKVLLHPLLTRRIPAAMTDTWQARKLSTGFHQPSKIPIFQVDFLLCRIYSLLCISRNVDATLFECWSFQRISRALLLE